MYSMEQVGVAGTASRGGDQRIRYVLCGGRDRSCWYSSQRRRPKDKICTVQWVLNFSIAVLLKGQFTHLTHRLKSSKIVHDDRSDRS